MARIKYLDFAKSVDDCKNLLKSKHEEHNIYPSDDISLEGSINLLDNYPQPEFSNYTPQMDIPELPDLFALADAEPLIQENTQATIIVRLDYDLTSTFSIGPGEIIKTSDGAIYTNETLDSKNYTHTWDLSKDIPVKNHFFKLRWIMGINTSSFKGITSYATCLAAYQKNVVITNLISTYPYIIYRYFDTCTFNVTASPYSSRILLRAIMTRNCQKQETYDNGPLPLCINSEQFTKSWKYGRIGNIKTSYIFNGQNSSNVLISTGIINCLNLYHEQEEPIRDVYLNAVFSHTNLISDSRISINVGNTATSSTQVLPCIELTFDNNFTSVKGAFQSINRISVFNFTHEVNFNLTLPGYSDTIFSRTGLINLFNHLKDLTGESAKTLRIGSSALNALTDEEKAIAINKNWTLS